MGRLLWADAEDGGKIAHSDSGTYYQIREIRRGYVLRVNGAYYGTFITIREAKQLSERIEVRK